MTTMIDPRLLPVVPDVIRLPSYPTFDTRYLDDYFEKYGSHIGREARKTLRPLHDPNVSPPLPIRLKRPPFPAQSHAITASVYALDRLRSVFIVGEMGTGKASPMDSKLLTPHGMFEMRDAHVGMELCAVDGSITTITGVFPQGTKDVYEIAFSDGTSARCCEDHLWAVQTTNDRFRRPDYFRVLDVRTIISDGIKMPNGNCRYYIPIAKPVNFHKQYLPLDPYVLGVLLGDGCIKFSGVQFTSADEEIVEAVRDRLPEGMEVVRRPSRPYDYGIKESANGVAGPKVKNQMMAALKYLKLAGKGSATKRIPHEYLHGSIGQRLDMLRGLMDTDGSVDRNNGVTITLTSKGMCEDIVFLVQSLGGVASLNPKKMDAARASGKFKNVSDAWRVHVRMPHRINPFMLHRKASAYKPAGKYGPVRAIVSIKKVGHEPCQCISVAHPSHLYMMDHCIVTHNTMMAMGAVEQHAVMQQQRATAKMPKKPRAWRASGQHAYRCIVFCPGQLVPKWGREIMETVPNANVVTLEKWTDIITINKKIGHLRPSKPTYYIISRDRAKLSAKWMASYRYGERDPNPCCPQCGNVIKDEKDKIIEVSKLKNKKHYCKALVEHFQPGDAERGDKVTTIRECGAPLWTYVGADSRVGADAKAVSSKTHGGMNRWEPAKYVHKHMNGFFDYLIIDEVHEEKSAESAQANAMGALVAATKYHIALTGTLIGGYANHLRPLLWRMSGRKMQRLGYSWSSETPFNRDYGRIETTIATKGGGEFVSNSNSRGSKTSKVERVRPGIMPTLFGDLLMEQCVFLGLAEISENLPLLEERVIGVPLGDQAREYARVEEVLADAVRMMVALGDRRLLATMLQCLLCYPDHPFGWEDVGYWDKPKPGQALLPAMLGDARPQANSVKQEIVERTFVPVVKPRNLDDKKLYPKEERLLEDVKREIAEGRQCWVFVQYTGERNVAERIRRIMEEHGIKVRILPASVSPDKREEWIAKHGRQNQVIISHPKLVETGLDLFDKNGGHNFSTLMFYETGYNTFTLRQASRRSWRIGQKLRCRVYYYYYEGTMQSQAMELMGKKLTASLSLEGKFSSEGLAAMGADEGGIEMALAKKLASMEKADESQTARAWAKIQGTGDDAKKASFTEDVKKIEQKILKQPAKITPKDALKEMEALLASLKQRAKKG